MADLAELLSTGTMLPGRHRSRRLGQPGSDRRRLAIYRLLGLEALLIVFLMAALGFTYRGDGIHEFLIVFGIVLGIAAIIRWRRHVRMAAAIEAAALMSIGSLIAVCLTIPLAALGVPYRDALLARTDRILFPFLSWPDLARSLAQQAELTAVMCTVYSSLHWQPVALIVALTIANQQDRMWRFVHAWMLALVAAIAIYAVMPAVTPYVHYGFLPKDLPYLTVNAGWHPAELIANLRSGALRELGMNSVAGLITFPSFHAAGAILLAWGFRRVPIIGGGFVALNIAMLVTVPLIGSHYFVDVVAGAGIAILGIAGSRGLASVRRQYARATANSTASTIASLA